MRSVKHGVLKKVKFGKYLDYNSIHIGTKKEHRITNILKRVETVHKFATDVLKLKKVIQTHWLKDPALTHDFYKSHFNLVDRADRYIGRITDHHPNQRWRSKMLFAILRFATLNVWSRSTTVHFRKWHEFRSILAQSLIDFIMA